MGAKHRPDVEIAEAVSEIPVRLQSARQLAVDAGGVVRFGDDTAERIATASRKPSDWLDADHSDHLPDLVRRLTPEKLEARSVVASALLAAQKK